MEHFKNSLVWRDRPDPMDRSAHSSEVDGREAGSTLIAVMVALIVVAVAVAIAVPVLVGSNGVSKGAAAHSPTATTGAQGTRPHATADTTRVGTQARLTNALTTTSAIFTGNHSAFPSTSSSTTPPNQFVAAMRRMSPNGTPIVPASTTMGLAARRGSAAVGVYSPTASVAFIVAADGATICWGVINNEASTPVTVGGTTIPAGEHFLGYTISASEPCTVNSLIARARTTGNLQVSFAGFTTLA